MSNQKRNKNNVEVVKSFFRGEVSDNVTQGWSFGPNLQLVK